MRAVAVAATQRGGDRQDDVVPEYGIGELSSAFSGYALPYLSRPLVSCFRCCFSICMNLTVRERSAVCLRWQSKLWFTIFGAWSVRPEVTGSRTTSDQRSCIVVIC
ncbi:hypothetical protein Droror1_Dr00005291 [Drosera rotundifolia]